MSILQLFRGNMPTEKDAWEEWHFPLKQNQIGNISNIILKKYF